MTTAMTTTAKASPLYALAARFNIEPTKLIEVLRGTVIKPDRNGKQATNEEVAAFCIVADQYNLNPFTKEIHAFASGDKGIVPIVGIDGWTKVVNARGDFDGLEFDDHADDNGDPVAVTCRMFVKGRSRPVAVTERFSECNRANSIPWRQMPWRMLRHKAYMQAARYAFGLAGIYDQDEANDMIRQSQGVKADPVPVKADTVAILKRQALPEPVSDPDAALDAPATAEPAKGKRKADKADLAAVVRQAQAEDYPAQPEPEEVP
jgi:phage recombination protein Bet